MKKQICMSLLCTFALASNYKLMPLSADGLALSGTNIAKSYGADAAIYNPANMAFLGDRPQIALSATMYHIGGAKYIDKLGQYDVSTNLPHMNIDPNAYLNADDAQGRDYNFGMGTAAFIYPINDKHFVGLGSYTDMAAVYGWNTPYARMLLDNFDLRSATTALSYAYKFNEDFSIGAALTVNHAKLKYSNSKISALNQRYFGNGRVCLDEGRCTVEDVANAVYSGKAYTNDDYKITRLVPHNVYHGKFEGNNGLRLGYKLSATYSPSALDHQLNLSVVYTSKYKSDFNGMINSNMARWSLFDFMIISAMRYPGIANSLTLPGGVDFKTVLSAVRMNMTDESPNNAAKVHQSGSVAWTYPSSLNLSASYTYGRHDFLFSYAHTFWSKVKNLHVGINNIPKLDMKNPSSLLDVLLAHALLHPVKMKWKDTDYFGIGYRYNGEKWAFMAGFATENTPLDRREMTFLSKDSRIYQFSLGAEYKAFKDMSLQLAFAHQMYSTVETGLVDDVLIMSKGKFYDQKNEIITAGIKYRF